MTRTRLIGAALAFALVAASGGVQSAAAQSSGGTAVRIGTVRAWPTTSYDGVDFMTKPFVLRGLGRHIEVWVGADLPVATDDCRSSNPANLVVTDAQIRNLIDQFESVIRPVEAKLFGAVRPRDGSAAQPELLDPTIPPDSFRGDGDRVVVLVDNIAAGGQTISFLMDVTDRNLVTIHAQGWPTGEGPHPRNLGPDPCRTFSGYAVPNFEESLLAHEYNHLTVVSVGGPGSLGSTALWITEGAAEAAAVLTGYSDPSKDNVANFVTACFLGRQGTAFPRKWFDPKGDTVGGPENSLSSFHDPGQGFSCEYGPPKTLMLYLADRYGVRFLRDLLFTTGISGITDGLDPTLAKYRSNRSSAGTLQDWSTMLALDAVLDDGARLDGTNRKQFQTTALHAGVNFDTPLAYASPGAPANGADFVRLRNATGRYFDSGAITSLRFDGPTQYPPAPVEWIVDPSGHGAGNPALYSGAGDSTTDRSIIRSITVPAGNPVLSFDARYDTEPDYDYGFVQVSTDGGHTFESRAATTTRADSASDADPAIMAQLPGFNGDSGGWTHQTVDLSDLAGQTVLVAFRLMADGFVNLPGFWVDNIAVGATAVSDGSTAAGWSSPTEVNPVPVAGVSVRLVGYDNAHTRAVVIDLPLDTNRDGVLGATALRKLRDAHVQTVAAIVNHFAPDERLDHTAPYRLTVNGVVQPGG